MAGEAQLPGSSIAAHMPLLSVLAREAMGTVVELGVGAGWSTIALYHGVEGRPQGCLVSYDLNHECRELALSKLGKVPGRWLFRKIDSVEAAKEHENGSIDLLFVDTDHTLERSRRELEAWLPKISDGGMIAGHDYLLGSYHGEKYGVQQAVSEFYARHTDRFQLQVFPCDCGLYLLRPR